MPLPTKDAATTLLHQHVRDDYQRHHALMVATALEGHTIQLGCDKLGIDLDTHIANLVRFLAVLA